MYLCQEILFDVFKVPILTSKIFHLLNKYDCMCLKIEESFVALFRIFDVKILFAILPVDKNPLNAAPWHRGNPKGKMTITRITTTNRRKGLSDYFFFNILSRSTIRKSFIQNQWPPVFTVFTSCVSSSNKEESTFSPPISSFPHNVIFSAFSISVWTPSSTSSSTLGAMHKKRTQDTKAHWGHSQLLKMYVFTHIHLPKDRDKQKHKQTFSKRFLPSKQAWTRSTQNLKDERNSWWKHIYFN